MTKEHSVARTSSVAKQAVQITALIMAHGLAGGAYAQSATNAQPAGITSGSSTNATARLPEVVVTGEKTSEFKPETLQSPKFTEPLLNVPQTVTVVPKAVMEQQGATTLRDVLRNVPGISFQAGEGGTPAGDQMTIRGFSARTDMFIDGVRDFGGYSRDPFNFEQVEVSKGPASSYAGRGSTGGSINLQSKEPERSPFYGGSFGLGTDDYARATVDLNQPVDVGIAGTAIRFNGMAHTQDTPGRDVVNDSRFGLAPSVAFGLGTPTRVTFSFFHLQQDNLPDYGIPWVPANTGPLAGYGDQPAPVDYSNFYGLSKRDYEKTRTDLGTIKLEHDFNEHFSLRNLTRYGETARDSIITSPRFSSPNTSTDIRRTDWKSRDQTDTIFSNQTDLTSRFETGKIEHTLVTGLEIDHEEETNYGRSKFGPDSPDTDLFDPHPGDPYTDDIRHDGSRVEAKSDSVAVSVFDTVKFTEHWQLTGGVRFDSFGVDYRSIATNGVTTADLSRSDSMFSYRVGLVYKPLPNGSIYAAYGTSFNPAAEGLSLATGATAANNINTDPEQSNSYELGTKWDLLDRRLSLSFAVFRTDKTNARTEDPTDPADVIVLDGQQRVQGLEFGAAGSLTDKWKVFAGYTYLDSEIIKSKNAAEVGNELSNTPRHSFSLWTTYQLPGNIEVGGGPRYVGSRFSSTANTREAPGYWLGDVMASWAATKNLTLRVNVYNLTNEKYIDRVGGGHFVPGPGRAATLTASFKF